jgi:hypothetical protein
MLDIITTKDIIILHNSKAGLHPIVGPRKRMSASTGRGHPYFNRVTIYAGMLKGKDFSEVYRDLGRVMMTVRPPPGGLIMSDQSSRFSAEKEGAGAMPQTGSRPTRSSSTSSDCGSVCLRSSAAPPAS